MDLSLSGGGGGSEPRESGIAMAPKLCSVSLYEVYTCRSRIHNFIHLLDRDEFCKMNIGVCSPIIKNGSLCMEAI